MKIQQREDGNKEMDSLLSHPQGDEAKRRSSPHRWNAVATAVWAPTSLPTATSLPEPPA
jgi:hypothetical protein